MQQFEIFARQWIFIVFPQIPQIVGVIEIFEARRITSELFVVIADGAGILHAPVDHLRFPLPPEVKLDWYGYDQDHNAHERDHQHQHEQDVTVFSLAVRSARPGMRF